MDVLATTMTQSINTLVAAVVGAIVAAAIGAIKDRARMGTAIEQALRSGMRALLWRELKNLHSEAAEKGGMTIEDRRHMDNVYNSYHSLGGNGTGTKLYEEAMSLPIIE